MGLHQFECRSCGKIFWMNMADQESRASTLPSCKACDSVNLAKRFPRSPRSISTSDGVLNTPDSLHRTREPQQASASRSRMNKRGIILAEHDLKRLTGLVERTTSLADREYIQGLREELARASVMASEDIPADVITMNSRVVLRDMSTGQTSVCTLVFPGMADPDRNRVSILAPIGTAIIGYRVGDIVELEVPAGTMRLEVLEVLYQPEAAGNFTE
jgi:regulator of nucleoside diphosphate kinase